MTMVESKQLIKKYGSLTAVDDISLSIEKGDVYGLLGPNGAGKSTTISMISTLILPTSGDIYVEGNSVLTHSKAIRKIIGYVPQDIALYPTLTAKENLSFFGRMHGLRGNILEKKIEEVLDTIGLKDKAKDRVDTYSGGMKRRLNIGVGLMNNPKLLILDEPTVGIDPQSRNHILETVKLLNQQGVTVIYTSHYMEEVETLCHHIGIMDHGRLIAQGKKEEVKQLAGNDEKLTLSVQGITTLHLEKIQSTIGAGTCHYDQGILTVLSKNVRTSLAEIIFLLNQEQLKITTMDIQEPNLESVFLHLTGRALRD